MATKPILFRTEMVRAILDGRKTETRRVAKLEPTEMLLKGNHPAEDLQALTNIFCPYRRGDVLWVRETWAKLIYPRDSTTKYVYKATDAYPFGARYIAKFRWRPSIHMPREAARIFLLVDDVKVERLQDITMNDMVKEGVIPETVTGGQWQQWQEEYMKPVWDRHVQPKDRALYGWDANPWVWVIEFERINREEIGA